MSTCVIEAGPGVVRQLCCNATTVIDTEMVTAALDGIDDPVALVDGRPVSVDSLWCAVLRSLDCGDLDAVIVIHPSWWVPARVGVISAAAQTLADDVVMRPRSWLLARAAPVDSPHATVVVEIAERLVVVADTAVRAEPRRGEPERVAEAVVRTIAGMTANGSATVVIDAPSSVGGAGALATMIADRLPVTNGLTALHVDDALLRQLAVGAIPGDEKECGSIGTSGGGRRRHRALTVLALLIATALGLSAVGRHDGPLTGGVPTTFLVEGRVAVQVPAHWTIQRVIAGPGSARVQVTSPSDPHLALHVTQSPIAAETLAGAAESLKHAIDAEPPGVFVDFNPSGSSSGRPAVTYREVRAGHSIRWIVVLDGAVRIAIGCQNRPGDDDAMREVCDLAVRSAHALR